MLTIKKNITKINRTVAKNRKKKYIVIHYTANNGDTAKGNSEYFKEVNRNASAHYFIDEKEIYQVVEDKDVAWSVGAKKYRHKDCRNENSINIELCSRLLSGTKDCYYFKDETIKQAQELTAMLMKQYNIPVENVLRHYDVTGKICPQPYINNNLWRGFKQGVIDKMIDNIDIKINGKNKTVHRILVNGENYIKLRDFPEMNVVYNKESKKIEIDY